MIQIKEGLKKYGKDLELWYYPHQGDSFPLLMDTKKGYLVLRENHPSGKNWLVKHKHGSFIENPLDEEIV